MRVAAGWGQPVFVAVVMVWLLWGLARGSRDDWMGAVTAVLSAGLALAVNLLISHFWARPRPFADHPGAVHVLLAHSADASFPSDHAAAGFAVAVVLLRYHRRLGWAAVAAAVLMCFARVYVGDHYPGDVLAGAAIGTVAGIALGGFGAEARRRLADRRLV
jgi:undecaprenyl-diphosphatase